MKNLTCLQCELPATFTDTNVQGLPLRVCDAGHRTVAIPETKERNAELNARKGFSPLEGVKAKTEKKKSPKPAARLDLAGNQ